jgi:hypothetical protein
MIPHAPKRDRRAWLGLVLAAAAVHAAIFVPVSHADEPGAPDTAGQNDGQSDGRSDGQGAVDGAPPPRSFGLPQRVGWSWDLEVDLGLRLAERDVDAARGMARVQAGALWANEPYYFSFGATAELGGAADRGLGAQVTMTHLYAGTWAHLGASWLPRDSAAMTSVGVGWSLFGVEWQHRLDDGQGDALLLHVRLPLGTTWFLLTHKPAARPRR